MQVSVQLLEDRPHWVVPTVMITVGVFHGSGGPIRYTADALRSSVRHWNGRPCVAMHPELYPDGCAGRPEVFNRQKVGYVFNTRFDGRRLLADAWLDVARVEIVDLRIAESIKFRRMVEVSTGLLLDTDQLPGVFNGRHYIGTARKLRPDHLAILPDQVGACSIADGAGLIRNELVQDALLAPEMAFT